MEVPHQYWEEVKALFSVVQLPGRAQNRTRVFGPWWLSDIFTCHQLELSLALPA